MYVLSWIVSPPSQDLRILPLFGNRIVAEVIIYDEVTLKYGGRFI